MGFIHKDYKYKSKAKKIKGYADGGQIDNAALGQAVAQDLNKSRGAASGGADEGFGTKSELNQGFLGSGFEAGTAKLQKSNYGDIIGQAGQQALNTPEKTLDTSGSQAVSQQQANLANELRATAAGGGAANAAAQAQLQQATDQNVKMAAGQIASQKGMNPALQARLIGQNQAAAQQQAANQSAALKAQTSLGAQGQLAGALQGQRAQELAQQQAQLGQQQANIANRQAYGQLLGTAAGAQNAQNQASIANLAQANQVNAATAAQNQATKANLFTSGINTLGNLAASFAWEGGKIEDKGIKHLAKGGPLALSATSPGSASGPLALSATSSEPQMQSSDSAGSGIPQGPQSQSNPAGSLADALKGIFSGSGAAAGAAAPSAVPMTAELPAAAVLAHGGSVYMPMKDGRKVPGKAEVEGDSPKNDKVPAMLSPGEIVIPRSKAKDPEAAKEFVEDINHKKPGKEDKVKDFLKAISSVKDEESAVEPKEGYAKVLHSHKKLDARLKKLEELAKKLK